MLTASGGTEEHAHSLKATAIDIIWHYEQVGHASGCARDAVIKLLCIRETLNVKADGRVDRALEVGIHSIT
jgi:nuclear pore complex protein Nup93